MNYCLSSLETGRKVVFDKSLRDLQIFRPTTPGFSKNVFSNIFYDRLSNNVLLLLYKCEHVGFLVFMFIMTKLPLGYQINVCKLFPIKQISTLLFIKKKKSKP